MAIIAKRLRLAGHVARMEECRNAWKNLTDKYIGNWPLGSLITSCCLADLSA